MPIALEVRGLAKRFHAGAPGCLAAATVLRSIDLCVRGGEAIAIVGAPGCGKSTLLLCLAGLVAPDAGDVRWFGERGRAAALRRVVYHVARTDLLRAGRIEEPNLHLVDVHHGVDPVDLERWIHARRAAGDAVIVASREPARPELRSRVLHLARGVLLEQHRKPKPRVRVAEPLRE